MIGRDPYRWRFLRFVVMGLYSPSLMMIGQEPLPDATIRKRWRQWRARDTWAT